MEIVKVEATDYEMLVIQKGTIKEYIREYVKAYFCAYGHFKEFPRYYFTGLFIIPLIMIDFGALSNDLSQGIINTYSVIGGIEGALLAFMYITGNWKVVTWPFLFLSWAIELKLKKKLTTLEFQGIAYRFTKAGYSMSLLREIPNCDESCLETWHQEVVGREYTAYKEMVVWACEKRKAVEWIAAGSPNLPGVACLPFCVFSTKDKNFHVVEEQLLRLGFEKR